MSDQRRLFANEDEETQYYLGVLRDGTREEKIEARERLSQLFEARGMFAEACELLEGNARTGLKSRNLFTRLASLYRRLGRDDDADAAMAEAASMMGSAPSAPVPGQPMQLTPRQSENWGLPPGQSAGPPPGQPYVGPPGYVPAQPKKKRSTIKTMGIGCLGCAGLLVLLLIVVAAISPRGATSTSTASAPPTAAPATAQASAKPDAAPAAAQPAPTPKPVAKAEEKSVGAASIGQRVESGGIALTVMGIQKTDSLSQIMKAKPGRTFLVADVLIESVTRDNAAYNPVFFKVKDSEGQEYNGSLFGDDKSLKAGELPKGDKVRGSVAFDTPSGATGLVLSYQPLVILGGYQTIRIALE
jgi:hypothetical protein